MTELLLKREMDDDYRIMEKLGLQELNAQEATETQGGILLGFAFFSAVVGYMIGNILFN